ncbi:hypothetical protein F5H01DRAFT_331275 [Linnemannia elongata]|nr:hypothetical protein F5H01DRAFT_331275 [Linnemannia elongata]
MAKTNANSAPNKGKRAKKAQSDDDFNEIDDSSNNNNNDDIYEADEDKNEDGEVDDGEYEVERVVGHKRAGQGRYGTLWYLIKWKGYGSDANTWVKGSDVNCPALVNEYWQRYKQAGGKRSDPLGDESNPAKRKAAGSSSSLSSRGKESSRGQAVAAKKRRIGSHSSDEDSEYRANSDSRSVASERANTEDEDDESERETEVERTRRSTESNEQETSEIDEIEVYDVEEGGSWSPPEDWASWGNHIDYIRAIMQSNDTRLTVFLRWKNGRETTHDIEVAHEKFPLLLIRYYENHLRFLRIADQES